MAGKKRYQAQHDHAPIRLIIDYQLNCVSDIFSCMHFKCLFTFLFKVTQAISMPIARLNPGLKMKSVVWILLEIGLAKRNDFCRETTS